MNKNDIEAWCNNIPLKTTLDSRELGELEHLITLPAFSNFLGLLLASKQAQYVQLANLPLGTAELSARASVIQGIIQGLDLPRLTLIELFTPEADETRTGPANEGAR